MSFVAIALALSLTTTNIASEASARVADERGPCNLINNRWRTLIPETGTYTSPEFLHALTSTTYTGAQAYRYADGRPTYYVDPDGRFAFVPFLLAGALVGVALGFGNDVDDADLRFPVGGAAVGGLVGFGVASLPPWAIAGATRLYSNGYARLAALWTAIQSKANSCGESCSCAGPTAGRRISDVQEVYRRLEDYHGIDPTLASERLHQIKEASGLGPADNVLFDLTGGVHDAVTDELLGLLTEGGAK